MYTAVRKVIRKNFIFENNTMCNLQMFLGLAWYFPCNIAEQTGSRGSTRWSIDQEGL